MRKENNLGADVVLRQDEDVLTPGSLLRCGPSLPLAGRKIPRPASVPPNQRDGIWFRHHLLWIARMIMMTMHFIKDENGKRRCRSTLFT